MTTDTARRHRRKYESGNPVHRWALRRFFRLVREWLDAVRPGRVLDFGCGEGYFWTELAKSGPLPEVVGIDLRADAVAVARRAHPQFRFTEGDLLGYDPGGERFDLAVCSEVLEHLRDPLPYLACLCRLADRVLLTVPNEPLFRLCNLLRGRDVLRLGSHPEHVQHWSAREFRRYVSGHLMVESSATTFPFTLVLGRPKIGTMG